MTVSATLTAEFAKSRRPDKREKDWLRSQGVPPLALFAWPGPIKVVEIETHPLGVFDFTEVGCRAFVVPVLCGPQYSDPMDLIA